MLDRLIIALYFLELDLIFYHFSPTGSIPSHHTPLRPTLHPWCRQVWLTRCRSIRPWSSRVSSRGSVSPACTRRDSRAGRNHCPTTPPRSARSVCPLVPRSADHRNLPGTSLSRPHPDSRRTACCPWSWMPCSWFVYCTPRSRGRALPPPAGCRTVCRPPSACPSRWPFHLCRRTRYLPDRIANREKQKNIKVNESTTRRKPLGKARKARPKGGHIWGATYLRFPLASLVRQCFKISVLCVYLHGTTTVCVCVCATFNSSLLGSDGRQIGRMKSVMGTRSFSRNSAMSLSKFKKLNFCAIALSTKRVSGRTESSHRLCSPNVTLIMNHIKLQRGKATRSRINQLQQA